MPEFLLPFASMHDAMRRDAGRLQALAARLDAGGPAADAAGVARWWRRFEHTIVGHHSSEDDVVFPAMGERLADFAPARERLVDQHHALDRRWTRCGPPSTPRRATPLALDRLVWERRYGRLVAPLRREA